MIPRNISHDQLERFRKARWLGRTNLLWLCNNVLGYKDVCEEVHGPILSIVQQFPEYSREAEKSQDKISQGSIKYVPRINPYDLEGKRRVLILDPRGGLKTTINCIAHTIQWILNFPHISILIVQANSQKAEDILREIKQHFQYNNVFRELYPDYCPQKHISDWGNRQEFDVPDQEGRAKILEEYSRAGLCPKSRKEHTCMTASIDKGTAGYHFDVIKFSDIVEENNTRTPDQMKQVIYTFNMMENLLVRPTSWIDVEGTRYNSGDLYGVLIDMWERSEEFRNQWNVHVRSCWKRDFGDVAPRYTPDSLKLPFLRDEQNRYISWWPERMSYEDLKRKETVDRYVFATQQLNDPVGFDDENKIFPLKYIRWISREEFAKVPISFYQTTVDTAETVGIKSNNSCITTCAFDRFGRCYVVDVILGKMLPDKLIETLFEVCKKHKPARVLIEETSFVRGLKPSIKRREDMTNTYLPIDFLRRETTSSKLERVQNTLQPWFRAGEIVLLDDLVERDHIIREFDRFPGWDDDFLDTLADQFQNRDWFGRESPNPRDPRNIYGLIDEAREKHFRKLLNLDDDMVIKVPDASIAWKIGGP